MGHRPVAATSSAIASFWLVMTQASKAQRYRDRKAGRLPPLPICLCCGKTIRNGDHLPLCQRCWLKTPDGLAYIRAKTARSRANAILKADALTCTYGKEGNQR